DHSLVWEMRAAGQIPADESIEHAIPRNVITRSLGPQEHVKVDIEGPFPIEVGDTFLLCSDGLTGRVPDDEIGPILAYMSVKEATDLLTDLANLRGGPDNITVIVGKVTGAEMTSRASAADPLVVGGASKESTAVHPAFWITSGVLILAAAALQVTGQSLLSLVLAAIGGCVGLVALAKVMGIFRDSGISLSGGRKLGKGPHRTANVRSARDFAEWMRITAENARRAVELRQWSVDWTTWDSLVGKGLNPSDAVPPDEVARRYAQALRDLLGQVRERIVADPHNGDHFS
ncbi:MAG: hypothetical protein KDA99_05760, partial [Planctomycetales bacterium]|nr:hypothetical protein [Planctomycetales bacterium]